jgi:hypothetical protein
MGSGGLEPMVFRGNGTSWPRRNCSSPSPPTDNQILPAIAKRSSDATPSPVQVTGAAATTVKRLGSRTIGVP